MSTTPCTTWIGAHTSAAGGAPNALREGQAIGASTVQLFTSNQKQWQGRTIPEAEVHEWKELQDQTGIQEIMSHSSYLINLGSPDPELLYKSRQAFREELHRCNQLNIAYLNFHPGAATKGTEEQCLETIVQSLLGLEDLIERGKTKLLLETTAGQGTSVGHKFEQLAYIIQRVPYIGVCIDTCHLFVAGYDVRTKEAWEKTLQHFDATIGLPFLRAFHINDSMKDLGSRVDRHATLGNGKIGLECFEFLMTDPRTTHLPKYLETPEGPPRWKEEIALLRKMATR